MAGPGLTDERYLDLAGTETGRLGEIVAAADPERPVPTCPDWTIRRLAVHVGGVQRWATAVVETGAMVEPRAVGGQAPRDPAGIAGWLVDGARRFGAVATSGPLDRPCWAWGPDQRVRFWVRRVAHETLVHRVDAELAVGTPPGPIEPEVAVDAIAELFENAAAVPWLRELRGHGETIHLHATDAPGEWLLRLDPDGWEVRPEHGKGDVALRGPAAALLLTLLGRSDSGRVEVLGEPDVFDRFAASFRF